MFHPSDLFITLCIVFHVGFMILESLLWTKPSTRKRFGLSEAEAQTTAKLAFNQGIYNLFLAAGLIFAQFFRSAGSFPMIAGFFLACIIVAGITGGLTVSRRIFFIQAGPAILASLALFAGY
jgi:putative membrane protein